jgi:hypothetical protein
MGLPRSLCVLAAALALPASAEASELIARDARDVKLEVSSDGMALVSYDAHGKRWHVLARGAINARPPSPTEPQVSFELDYSGGWGAFGRPVWRTFQDQCREYDGPRLAWFVIACKAGDGSYWALQSWQRMLPNAGREPNSSQAAWELRLSHWRGPLAELRIELDWAYRRFDHLYGTLTYDGRAVHGFRSTSRGVPLDTYGRNIYVDTLNSAYGGGWKRENSFLAQRPTGSFCYGFYPGQANSDQPAGAGEAYRATVIGPGVTPDVTWRAREPGPYDPEADLRANEEQRALARSSSLCRPN